MGLSPGGVRNLNRVPMPPITGERRKDLIKVVKSECESSKNSVRNIRRDSNDELKKSLESLKDFML